MKNSALFVISSLVILFIKENYALPSARCPQPSSIIGCTCYGSSKPYFNCVDNTVGWIDLKGIFANISREMSGTDKRYSSIFIGNDKLTELPENVFGDIIFEEITLNAFGIARVHINAFNASNRYIKRFDTYYSPIRDDNGPQYEIFTLVNQFISLEWLELRFTRLNSIPKNAIQNLRYLSKVVISESPITAIGESAFFNLPMLNFLDLHGNQIEYIFKSAIFPSVATTQFLQIDLRDNKKIYQGDFSFSFVNGGSNKLPVMLILTTKHKNVVPYLDSTIFNYLIPNNKVCCINTFNPYFFVVANIDCQNCRNKWLLDTFKKDEYNPIGITCSSGAFLDSPDNFKDCTSSSDRLVITQNYNEGIPKFYESEENGINKDDHDKYEIKSKI